MRKGDERKGGDKERWQGGKGDEEEMEMRRKWRWKSKRWARRSGGGRRFAPRGAARGAGDAEQGRGRGGRTDWDWVGGQEGPEGGVGSGDGG